MKLFTDYELNPRASNSAHLQLNAVGPFSLQSKSVGPYTMYPVYRYGEFLHWDGRPAGLFDGTDPQALGPCREAVQLEYSLGFELI